MKMTLDVPDELAALLHELEPEDGRAVLVETVCGLYSRRKITSGKGARLLGLDRFGFQQELGRREIPLHYTLEDLKHDAAFARGQ
jgi:predicted HTH domain antitoxin